jgi:hypothetical protein
MRTILILLFIVTCCPGLFAQEVVATAGNTLSNSGGSISITIGEGVANTLTKGDKTITQGFQQGNLSVSIVSVLKDLEFSISVFPNPTSDVLTLRLTKEDLTGLQYLLFDISGRLISQKNLEMNETTINVNQLNNGIYLIKVQDGMKELKTFKIVKH